jgi:hypothetical protein
MPDISSVQVTEDITVLGGISNISVEVDFGPQGSRGSLTLYGNGKPTEIVLPETPQIYDTYVNLLPSDDEYLYYYQYTNKPGGPGWDPRFKLIPNNYSENKNVTFANGSATFNLNVASISLPLLTGNPTAANFNVQYSILGSPNPISSSISLGTITTTSNSLILPVTIEAIDFDGTAWINTVGQRVVHLFITVV